MKTTVSLFLLVLIAGFTLSLSAQKQRTKTIPPGNAPNIIENAIKYEFKEDGKRQSGLLVFWEDFDASTGGMPVGWNLTGNSSICTWDVDGLPKPPGYFTAPYSLNYNNGNNFNCGANFGYVTSPLINISGQSFDVCFMYSLVNECGTGFCGFDDLFVTIYDEFNNQIISYQLPATAGDWFYVDINEVNTSLVENIYIEFSFFTYDSILNDYEGPFIDNFKVYRKGEADIPLSNWALLIGIALIVIATVIRFRRIA
jgi:hypothetical protein